MAVADLAAYKAALENRPNPAPFVIASSTGIAGRVMDLWVPWMGPYNPVGAAVTTAAAPTRATSGAMGQQNGGSGALQIMGGKFASLAAGTIIWCDRLSHQGGLVGNVTTSQTTNLSTAALTRYTSGVGVMMGLTIYTQIGTTGSTISVTYTDTADASQTAPAIVIGGTGFREANRMLQVPLVSGGVGVKSVQSVIINTTSTGTAGAFGVTLFKPLFAMSIDSTDNFSGNPRDYINGGCMGAFAEIVDDACLFPLLIANSGTMIGNGELILAEV
jgi:hypothetical protein